MRSILHTYSADLPQNAAFVNVTSVNLQLLSAPTQSPSLAPFGFTFLVEVLFSKSD